MPRTKIATLNLRINPALKAAVREAATREHRSVANMVEVLIRRHCDDSGIPVTEIPGKPVRNKDG
ncbi:MAG: hypothetical protein AAFX56_20840 [Pseudomonadota bacterium]